VIEVAQLDNLDKTIHRLLGGDEDLRKQGLVWTQTKASRFVAWLSEQGFIEKSEASGSRLVKNLSDKIATFNGFYDEDHPH